MSFSSDQPLMANQLPISFEIPKGEAFFETMDLIYKRIASSVNTKEGAVYLPQELATFQLYFTPNNPQVLRNVYRKVFNFGVIDQSGGVGPYPYTSTQPHGLDLTTEFSVTRLYGAATDPTNPNFVYIPLPQASPTLARCIELYLDATNVNIVVGQNRTNFTRCTIVFEYVKNQ